MKTKILEITLAIFAISVFAITLALAQSEPNIQFPVAELGNCESKEACHQYCDVPANQAACLDFAEKHNLMSRNEVSHARKFIAAGSRGPGGCTSKETCERFCNNVSNIKACVAFAEQSGIMPPEELEEARKVMAALESGAKLPGGCQNKDECEDYCSGGDASRMKECISFAKAAGFMSEEEAGEAGKMLAAIEKGVKPPKCRSKAACDTYCADEAHFEECIAFAEASGFMKPEEVDMARKTGGKGPGGCRGRECETFCNNPENQEVCFKFALEHDLISPEDRQRMEEGKRQMQGGPGIDPGERGFEGQGRGEFPGGEMRGGFEERRTQPGPDMMTQPQIYNETFNEEYKSKCLSYGGTWDRDHCVTGGGTMPQPGTNQIPSGASPEQLCAKSSGTWKPEGGCAYSQPPEYTPAPQQEPPPPTIEPQGNVFWIFRQVLGL